MTPIMDPFTTLLDLSTGRFDPEREVVERRLADMKGYYLEDIGDDDDTLVYQVFAIPVPQTCSEIQCSTTVMQPGAVGDEYFMTKGHFHEVRERSEIYIGIRGEGRLVMATEDGRSAVEPIRAGTVSYVPGGWAHRSVNVGDEPLIFFAAYIGDAGHDYGTIADRGLPIMVVNGASGPSVVDNPRYSS